MRTRQHDTGNRDKISSEFAARLAHLAGIIRHFNGHTLADPPDLLGSIPIEIIEISVAGIHVLAKSDAVKAVLEDQTISPGDSTRAENGPY